MKHKSAPFQTDTEVFLFFFQLPFRMEVQEENSGELITRGYVEEEEDEGKRGKDSLENRRRKEHKRETD